MKITWFIFTVVLGLTPLLIRVAVFALSAPSMGVDWLASGDIISFGLILMVTNINTLVNENGLGDNFRIVQIGVSLFFIVMFSAFYAVSCINGAKVEIFDEKKVRIVSFCFSLAALFFSYAVWDRISALRSLSVNNVNVEVAQPIALTTLTLRSLSR